MNNVIANDRARLAAILQRAQSQSNNFLSDLKERSVATEKMSVPARPLPQTGLGAEEVLRIVEQEIEPFLSASTGPRYFGFVTGGATPAALAADWLTSAYNQNVSNAIGSIASSVEEHTLNMLKQLFGLPDAFQGAFVTGATMANFVGLATARQWAGEQSNVNIAEQGMAAAPRIRILSANPHASLKKALAMLGFGRSSIEIVPSLPARESVDVQALRALLLRDPETPAIYIASAGTVNTVDFDDLAEVTAIAREHGRTWVHVDAAFGIFAACTAATAPLLNGLEHADSLAADGHKWLNVPYDCGFAFTKRLDLQEQVFLAAAPYLNTKGEPAPDFLNRTPENSRRFRALPAWASLLAYGRDGYRDTVERDCDFARKIGAWIEASPDFDLIAPVRMNVACVALSDAVVGNRDRAQLNQDFLDAVRAGGETFFTPSAVFGRSSFRIAVSNWRTTDEDLEIVQNALQSAVARLRVS